MKKIFDITANDLRQILRDKQTFLFLLLMPIAFTLLFGFAFGAFSKPDTNLDQRYLVAVINKDSGDISTDLLTLLQQSSLINPINEESSKLDKSIKQVSDEKIAGLIVIPAGFSAAYSTAGPLQIEITANVNSMQAFVIDSELSKALNRLETARVTKDAIISASPAADKLTIHDAALSGWAKLPIAFVEENSTQGQNQQGGMSASQVAPGMMLQFALAGLLTAGQVIVNERKSRAFQRLLTTATNRLEILFGHYFAIFILIFGQFVLLIVFGQLIMGLNYLGQAVATLLMALASSLCIAALGLLIGMFAKSDEQAIIFSLIPMFVFSGLGGAWMPLEFTGKTFQAIGHFSPVAWAMDGFKAILNHQFGLEAVWLPALALLGFGCVFFAVATWRIFTTQEK